jgi:arylsulfatase A-like enzyme
MRQGFDSYYGIPYSNDMKPPVLLRGAQVIEESADQATLTARYTAEAVSLIRQNRDRPFFLYLPHTFPHVPLFASNEFKGQSRRGLYGDVVAELDASVGRILDTLRELELERKTFVFFTSDNGPWLERNQNGGSAGLLRSGKGSTWEGGMRVPAIAWWPQTIRAGEVSLELASSTDLFATICALCGIALPTDRTLDSFDLRPLLLNGKESPRKSLLYYRGRRLMAARLGPWKAHFLTQAGYGQAEPERHDPPLLFHLQNDPSERFDLSRDNPQVIADIRQLVAEHESALVAPPSQLDLR